MLLCHCTIKETKNTVLHICPYFSWSGHLGTFPFHFKSSYSSQNYRSSSLLMTTRTVFILKKHLITVFTCTVSNSLSKNIMNNLSRVWTIILMQEASCFQWSLFRFHWIVCPVTWKRGVGSFGTIFLIENTAFMLLGGTGYDRNQLGSLKQPFKSRTSSDINQQDFTSVELC